MRDQMLRRKKINDEIVSVLCCHSNTGSPYYDSFIKSKKKHYLLPGDKNIQ